MSEYRIGDIVRIKPEWLDKGESADTLYIVADVNDATKRCYIEPLESPLALKPQNLVSFDMIQKA